MAKRKPARDSKIGRDQQRRPAKPKRARNRDGTFRSNKRVCSTTHLPPAFQKYSGARSASRDDSKCQRLAPGIPIPTLGPRPAASGGGKQDGVPRIELAATPLGNAVAAGES